MKWACKSGVSATNFARKVFSDTLSHHQYRQYYTGREVFDEIENQQQIQK